MNPADYYVHERSTVSGSTVYEPMLTGQDPDAASTAPQFWTRDEAEVWVWIANGNMVTATYTDPTTGWQTRVEVIKGERADDDRRLNVIRNADDETARVPATTLSEFHREQDSNREYLPASRLGAVDERETGWTGR